MQDDEAMERGIQIARATNEPFYVLHPNGIMRDETGQFPDKPIVPTRNMTHDEAMDMMRRLRRSLGIRED